MLPQLDQGVKSLKFFLAAEILLLLTVIALFKIFPPHIAGLIGGVGFLILGVMLLRFTFRWPKPWRSSLTWATLIYVIFSVIPILGSRLWNWGLDFKDIYIFGLSGPQFHRVSEVLYLFLIGSTVFELIRLRRAQKK